MSTLSQLFNLMDSSLSKKRLKSDLEIFKVETESLKKSIGRRHDFNWVSICDELVRETEDALNEGDIDKGWKALKAARRWTLYGLARADPTQFKSRALSVYRESTSKKIESNWRVKAIKDYLTLDGKNFNDQLGPEDAGKVFAAQQILDMYQDNAYEKNYLLKNRLVFLNFLATAIILGWIWLAPDLAELNAITGKELSIRTIWLAVVLAGMLGAITSGFTRSLGNEFERSRIPNQIAEGYISFSRLFLGAISAIGVTFFLASGLLNIEAILSFGLILAIAFIAGFTEKLMLNAIEASVSAMQKPANAADEQYVRQEFTAEQSEPETANNNKKAVKNPAGTGEDALT